MPEVLRAMNDEGILAITAMQRTGPDQILAAKAHSGQQAMVSQYLFDGDDALEALEGQGVIGHIVNDA